MNVTVVTSVYGGYDQLTVPPPQTIDAEWICVTDDPHVDGGGTWKIVVEPRPDLPARLAAKVAKCLPWWYASLSTDVIVWLDGSCRLRDSYALKKLVSHVEDAKIAQFVHPVRDCIYTEASFSQPLPKYAHQRVIEQVEHYRVDGHPAGWGLWATGCIVRRREPIIHSFGFDWLAEQVRWTNQDQLSEPYVLMNRGLRPVALPGSLLVNDLVIWTPHVDGT